MAIITKHSVAGFLVGAITVMLIELIAGSWSAQMLRSDTEARRETAQEAARQAAALKRSEAAARGVIGLNVADLACQFQDLAGKTISCADLRGKVTVLNLFATWCPPCREEMPSLEALWKDGDVAVYCVSEEDPADIARHPVAKNLRMPLYAFLGNVPEPLKATTLPLTYILDSKGRIVYAHVGGADWNHPEVRQMLAAVARMP
ncbi:hypothetical protein TDMWS_10280 [Thermodesulfomicrobium sp. WS]|uniref:TlpA family protein disulfide reductase n=1 Tax=Thermodesulfomicrobium sp. WS TaxID=3004129 RepID=UPI0024935182|nr:TlpA disulfide reductase family protein [Thermodesulfomicrobium sp. WS]BDV00943.1 hypothetical protein TDMWS_10280 [Thermodesulfomicrobium sp. WS]